MNLPELEEFTLVCHRFQLVGDFILYCGCFEILCSICWLQNRLKQFSFLTQKRQLSKQVRRRKTTAQAGPSGWILFKYTRVFYISLMFSNARHVLSQCNTRLRLLYLRSITRKCYDVFMKLPGNHFRILGPFQTPLHSCADPNWWVKYGRRAALESVRFGRLVLERRRTLNSAGSAALCDVGAAADSYGALIMCRT